jgi:SAM-dependent methyltransferase
MPFLDNTFDMVVTTDVLEHVIDLNYCCQQILRVLRPGGTLIIRVPNLEDLSGYLDKNIPYEYVHLRNFDLYGLRLLFEKIFHCTYLDHLYVAPVLSAVSRLKVRLLSQSNPIMSVLKSLEQDNHPLSFLKSISSISEEEFLDLACNLRENHPEIFNEFSEHIIHALEVNVVFKKN